MQHDDEIPAHDKVEDILDKQYAILKKIAEGRKLTAIEKVIAEVAREEIYNHPLFVDERWSTPREIDEYIKLKTVIAGARAAWTWCLSQNPESPFYSISYFDRRIKYTRSAKKRVVAYRLSNDRATALIQFTIQLKNIE